MTNEKISVLVVDDEPDMLWALNHALSRSGYDVVTASNASLALAFFERADHSFQHRLRTKAAKSPPSLRLFRRFFLGRLLILIG